jgi:mycothione reductase
VADFDLAIIGSGSGNTIVTPHFDAQQIAIIEEGVFGGTCLNVGCIPTKMYAYTADIAATIAESSRYGIDAGIDKVRWPDIRDRVFARIDPMSEGGRDYRAHGRNTVLYATHARFAGDRLLEFDDGRRLSADQIVIAAGSSPVIPEVVSSSGVPFHTSNDVMRIPELPDEVLILGGGFIGAEFAHIFSSFGVEVSVVSKYTNLLPHLDGELSKRFTTIARDHWKLHTGTKAVALRQDGSGKTLVTLADGTELSTDLLLVAIGRRPNTKDLGLTQAGVATHPDGRVVVDSFGRTTAEQVWAVGDVSSPYQLKHVANREARVVAHNLDHPDDLREFDHRFVPSAVFTRPQVASVGITENAARERGIRFVAVTQNYGDTAYGWAMEDRGGICKLVADPQTGLLLGAHIMGYQAAILIQPLVQAMSFGQRVPDLARGQYWIHPALTEVVENALLKLGIS